MLRLDIPTWLFRLRYTAVATTSLDPPQPQSPTLRRTLASRLSLMDFHWAALDSFLFDYSTDPWCFS